jgi:hypothetical protein
MKFVALTAVMAMTVTPVFADTSEQGNANDMNAQARDSQVRANDAQATEQNGLAERAEPKGDTSR